MINKKRGKNYLLELKDVQCLFLSPSNFSIRGLQNFINNAIYSRSLNIVRKRLRRLSFIWNYLSQSAKSSK